MNWIDEINADLIKGFSKSDLEFLIGLPKNTLAGVLKGNKKFSKKSELKIELWSKSEKPNPLDVVLPKIEKKEKPKTTAQVVKEAHKNMGQEVVFVNSNKICPLVKMIGESGVEFRIRVAEWEEQNNKQS